MFNRIYAISAANASLLAVLDIEGASNCDWESMTVGPAHGDLTGSYIYIGTMKFNSSTKASGNKK